VRQLSTSAWAAQEAVAVAQDRARSATLRADAATAACQEHKVHTTWDCLFSRSMIARQWNNVTNPMLSLHVIAAISRSAGDGHVERVANAIYCS